MTDVDELGPALQSGNPSENGKFLYESTDAYWSIRYW
jgi:hypothetical protein